MGKASWLALKRASPGPVWLSAWIAVTVPAPLVFYEATHRWEENQQLSMALRWTLGTLPVLAAAVSTRWTGRAATRRVASAFPAGMAAGVMVSAVFLAATVAFYRWVIPLDGVVSWSRMFWLGLPLAVAGAAVGCVIGVKGRRRNGWSARRRRLLGALVVVAGALLAPVTVRLGAEDSTIRYDEGSYGAVGPLAVSVGKSGVLILPAAGRYAVLAMGNAPEDPDCRVRGPGVAERRTTLVTIPPRDYGGDYATYGWVASFTVPGPGTYALSCRTSDPQADYTVGEVPQIRGAVGALIHWPLVVIWLIGSVPGLLIIASTIRRRTGQADSTGPA